MSMDKMKPEADLQPEAAREYVNPFLLVFPAEVWVLILNKIRDLKPKNLINLVNSNPLFREHFQSDANKGIWTLALFGTALPQLFKYLPGSDLLTLRKVSKEWRNIVDSFLESGDMWKLRDMLDEKYIRVNLRKRNEQFVNELRALPQAKLVGGAVKAKEFRRFRFHRFFQEFGTLVYHLELKVTNPVMEFVQYTCKLLRNIPNVKTMRLEFSILGHDYWPDTVIQFLKDNPLPGLPNLVSLEIRANIYNNDGVAEFIGEMLVKYGKQLENLYVSGFWIPLPSPMPLLTSLSLEIGDVGRYWEEKPTNLETLQSLRNLGAPLEKIKLNFGFDACLVELFKILEMYKDSLKQVSLCYPHSTWHAFSKASPPFPNQTNLPLLQELELIGYRIERNTSFDFLTSCPKLKRLEIQTKDWNYQVESGATMVEYNADGNKIEITKNLLKVYDQGYFLEDSIELRYMSPIWKALPLLESMILWVDTRCQNTGYKFSRKDYEDHQNKLKIN